MVGLSKPRSSQKPAAPKLSVPRPLNLPSLRKEHERFDRLGSGGGCHSGSGLGSGGRPSSSGFGWTKPAAVVAGPTRDNEASTVGKDLAVDIANDSQPTDQGLSNIVNGAVSRSGGTVYTPPSARIINPGFSAIFPDSTVANHAASILKGEDFPSLQASLPVNAGPQKKLEDLNQKQKLVPTQDYGTKQITGSQLRTSVDMRPQSLSKNNVTSRLDENGGETRGLGRSVMSANEDRNQEAYFPGPLPLVRLQPRSDWADDERDTGHGLRDKGKDHVYYRSEANWDTDFDLPRPSILPQKPMHIPFDKRGQRDNNGATKITSSEVTRLDTYPRDGRMSSREGREGSSFSPLSKNELSTCGVVNERNDVAWPPSINRETKENKYVPSSYRESTQNDSWRKDAGYKQVGKQPWNDVDLSRKRGLQHNVGDFHGDQYNRKRVETRPNIAASKSTFNMSGKGFSDNAPVLPFSWEKQSFLKSERSHVEDPFMKDFGISCFDEHDPFSGGFVGLVKKKKEVQKQTDFRDTVRESFEAELERVEKMQELERRRIIEEQEKAMELAHREEEERLRLVREEEEKWRRLEEEAREAAWRIEQEQLVDLRKAEEQRIARDEEKQKILMEEERRKQAAKQKLLELEERIAKRQAETSKIANTNSASFTDEKLPGIPAEKDFMKVADVGDWEENERTTDYFRQIKGQKWNISRDAGHYGRNIDIESESRDNNEGKIDDAGMGQGRSHANNYPRYADHTYQKPEAEEHYSFGRSRYAMRQPRVLPPPSMTSMHSSYRGFGANGMQHVVGSRNKLTMQTRLDSHQENLGLANVNSQHGNNEIDPHIHDKNVGKCDSQSTLSLCSPPDSPGSLSHDELGESGNSRSSTAAEVRDASLLGQGNSSVVLPHEAGKPDTKSGSSFASSGDDEWTIENDEQLQEQEEYDEEEEEDGFAEEDEIQDGEDEAVNLTLEYEGIHLDDKNSSEMVDNLILGFNEGVEVGMPNDEFDGNLSTEESKFVTPETSIGAMEEQVLLSNIFNDGQTLQHDGHSQVSTNKCSVVPQEVNKIKQDMVIQPETASETPATIESADNLESSRSSSLPMQSQVPSSTALTIMPPPSLSHGQPEIPVKFPFGLFSGPSLIPSPVPAIQIGSIQMPLHLHPPIAPSLGQMHTPQPPVFQFGQLRYTSAVSQGAVPLSSQSASFFQPDVSAALSSNQNTGGSTASQSTREASGHCLLKTDDLSTSVIIKENADDNAKMQKGLGNHSELGYRVENSFAENFKPLPSRETESLDQAGETSSESFSKERDLGVSKGQGLSSRGRGKRYVVTMRTAHLDSNGLPGRYRRQRTEFRVRNNSERKQPMELISSSRHMSDDKSSSRGIAARRGSRRTVPTNRQPKQTLESEGMVSQETSGEIESNSRIEKGGKDSLRKNKNLLHPAEDVDASFENGIVQIFEQPGIEAPSDDDDFIEVRSKRQMMNDRREQREKENKAKSQRPKHMPRRSRSSHNASFPSSKVIASVNVEASNKTHSESRSSDAHGLSTVEVSTGFISPIVAQPLPPVGSPPVKDDTHSTLMSQAIKYSETSSPCGSKNIQPGIVFESKNNDLNNVQTSMASQSNQPIHHRDMPLSQKQLDKIIKPVELGTHLSVGDALEKVGEPVLMSSSSLTEDKSFSSTASPINSLLAGEKIQFGAVTSPSILPNSSCVSHTIVPPGSCHLRAQVSNEVSAADNGCSLLLGKEKKSSESCANLEDCESEAEAAASAVAVAAITSDEIINIDLGKGSTSCAEAKTFGVSDITGVRAGVSTDQHFSTQSRAEESLTVALPADLSVETSIWPPLPSPQNANNQMLSHVAGGPHSQFPFYEMNPMLGGSSYPYGPLDGSSSTQSQSQKSNASVSGSLGSWHPHFGLDSFYGRPSGFTGPFIGPPGTIPGVQGPPHMVVYNHFAPVGQFGQVGLSFMGTTYVPSGKQPDWKHNPSSSAMGISEGDLKTLNLVSSQRNPTSMPAPVQHLAPGSPLLPLGSPLAMYDVSLFQSSSDMSVQSCWSHVPSSSVHSVPTSIPLQQQSESVLSSQLKVPAVDQPVTAKMYMESQISAPSENSKRFPVTSDGASTQLPDELGLASTRGANTAPTGQSAVASQPSVTSTDYGKKRANQYGVGNTGTAQSSSSSFRSHSIHHKNTSGQPYGNFSGYNFPRGGTQKNGSGAEWSNRRTVYQVRNQSLGGERSSASSKTKQIYVAKQATGSSRGSGGA